MRPTLALWLSLIPGHALAGNRLWLGYNPGTTACASRTTTFFNCILGQTNFNQLATGFPNGESLTVGGSANVSCNDADFQCVVNQGHFNPAPYDIVMQFTGSGWTGGWNGTTTISVGGRSVFINTALMTSGNSCEGQTCGGAHEAFEAATDGISCDCCNGQVHSSSCPACDSSCGRDNGNGGDPPWGCYQVTCGGQSYYMELVSKSQAAETDISGCVQLTVASAGPSDPCATTWAGYNGLYCGSSTENGFSGGDPSDLYDCQSQKTAQKTACPYGCTVEPAGTNDQCNAAPVDPCATAAYGGYYCGSSTQNGFAGGDPSSLYLCNNGKTQTKTYCPYGCTVEPSGTNDRCNAPPDGGMSEDAGAKGSDGGPSADAGGDAGSADSGMEPDGGPLDGGGEAPDAGAASPDGGPRRDAGEGPDGGQPSVIASRGCGCEADGGGTAVWALALVAMGAARRRRRPGEPPA
ncbi:MAG: MYXO-CTERM sorting domain-containing protein [Deltaproteobacteria bacterium]